MKSKAQILALGASVFSAVVASLCCIGPIVALLLGVGGFAGASLFAKWRLPLLVATLVLLNLAWYLASITPKQRHCELGGPFLRWFKGKKNIALCGATVFVLVVATFPAWFNAIAGRVGFGSDPAMNATTTQLAILHARIPSMDCAACAVSIRMKLHRQPGIRSVVVTFDTKEAEVQYDPTQISSKQIISKINETGFSAEPTTVTKSQ
jgi:copper chaperone CopZ